MNILKLSIKLLRTELDYERICFRLFIECWNSSWVPFHHYQQFPKISGLGFVRIHPSTELWLLLEPKININFAGLDNF